MMSSVVRGFAAPLAPAVGGFVLLGALGFAPPARGTVLLVPLTDRAAPARAALAAGMPILKLGPLGSIVARADKGHDDWAMLRRGIVVLAAPAVICGNEGALT
jgi:hypothetical protein